MKEKMKTMKMIHFSMIVALAVAYFILGDLMNFDFLNMPKIDSTSFIYLLIPMAAIILGSFLSKQQLKSVPDNLTLEEKIAPYQTTMIIRWALIEGAAFFILFVKKELLVLGLILIVYMAFLQPSEERMKQAFQMVGK